MESTKDHIKYYSISDSEVAKLLDADASKGLSEAQVAKRLIDFGYNKMAASKKSSPFIIFLLQFKSPIVYLLIVAAGLSFFFEEWLDGIAILIVILINAIIGFYMEFQAERSMDALKKLTTIPAKIKRDGTLREVDSINLVPGDIMFAEAGDVISADAIIFESSQLQVDESALTGESIPIEKQRGILNGSTDLADRTNSLFKGTHVTKGNVWAIIINTGMKTELGKIAGLVQTADQSITPLEKKLQEFSKMLITITVGLVVVVFIAGMINGHHFVEMLETSIALAVAAIPEGLPIVATLALAQGMLKMARYKVIVKKLSAVETLGGTKVICTDKTGTLTENKIIVSKVVSTDSVWNIGTDALHTKSFDILTNIAILCNTAELKHNNKELIEIGDPLETGLLKFAESTGKNIDSIRNENKKLKEEPFSSETKIMATMHLNDNKNIVYAKGAMEELIKRSDRILLNNEIKELTPELKQHWLNEGEKLAGSGLRMIGGAYKESVDAENESLSSNLIFVGLYGMMDPPRKEVFSALEECKTAGIKVVMITGDHPSTAKNIGVQLGIADESSEIILGSKMKEYEALTESDKQQWLNASIFARVSPKQKLDLVKVLQEKGNVVGMTGDGVNDAPALKKADIGIAMGERGTQVAQEVSDMILKNDSFTSIVTAIKQGRIIFENIRKFVIFLLSCNLSELLVIASASVFNLHFQLFPLQILFINLITDVLPALALGVTEGSNNIMKQPAKQIEAPIIDKERWWTIIFYSIILSITSLGAVFVSHHTVHKTELWNPELCNNILFFSLIFSQLLHVFNMGQTGVNFFKSEVFRSKQVWGATIISFLLIIVLYMIPLVRQSLTVYPLSVSDWLIISGSAFASLIIIQIGRVFKIVKQ